MKRKTSDAVEILKSLVGTDIKSKERIEELTLNAKIAQMIYEARSSRKLTQKQLAEKAGTTQPVIARLENAEYEGHSLDMLHRIAMALHLKLNVEFSESR